MNIDLTELKKGINATLSKQAGAWDDFQKWRNTPIDPWWTGGQTGLPRGGGSGDSLHSFLGGPRPDVSAGAGQGLNSSWGQHTDTGIKYGPITIPTSYDEMMRQSGAKPGGGFRIPQIIKDVNKAGNTAQDIAVDKLKQMWNAPPAAPGAEEAKQGIIGDAADYARTWHEKGLIPAIKHVIRNNVSPDTYESASKIKHMISGGVSSGVDMLSNAQEHINNALGKGVGQYVLPLGAAGILAYLMTSGKKKKEQEGANVNINVGGGAIPGFFNRSPVDVNSLANPKFASLIGKTAGISDAVAKVINQRVINKVIDKTIEDEAGTQSSGRRNKEIEITSKYPEMTEILKDEKNKAYLDRLLHD